MRAMTVTSRFREFASPEGMFPVRYLVSLLESGLKREYVYCLVLSLRNSLYSGQYVEHEVSMRQGLM